MTPENKIAAEPRATAATVATKFYLTSLGLGAAWAVGTFLFFHDVVWNSTALDRTTVFLVIGVAVGPFLAMVALNRWWHWLRRP